MGGEVFGRLYGEPERLDEADPDAAWAPKAHDALDQLPEFEALRSAVNGDPDMAALGTCDLMDAIAARLPELLREEEQKEGDAGYGAGEVLPGAADRLRAALRSACREAAEATAERKELLAGLAPGLDAAPLAHEQANPDRMRLAEVLRQNPQVQDVLRRAGRLQRLAAARQRSRSAHSREEVVDVERGADLGRVLPSQLAGLRHPRLRLLALRGIVERSLVQYRLEGTEPQGRGPIVVLLDESGSMGGTGHLWSRAVAIATLGIGAREKRAVTVIGFNTEITYCVRVDERGAFTRPRIDYRGTVVGADSDVGGTAGAALFVATVGCGGGTSYEAPFRAALNLGASEERSDLVFVTDGCCNLPTQIMDELTASKSKGLRVFGLTVGGGSTSAAVQGLCDECVDIDLAAQPADASVAACLP
jgi:uncharacterized protein with von Willebrand factor type A (vWA) domain